MVTFAAVVVTAFAGYGVSKSMNNSNAELSDLALANVEALAQDESSGAGVQTGPGEVHSSGLFGRKVKFCLCENSNPCRERL